MSEFEKAVGLRWFKDGKEDPHGDRYNYPRSELAMATHSDDELANEIYLNLPIDLVADTERMASGKTPSIAILATAQERLRWLSRRLHALEQRLNELEEERDIAHYNEFKQSM